MSNFEIGFFQLEKLIEASWSGGTILQFCVLQDLIDIHFYKMSDYERKAIHSFFQTKMAFERQLYNSDTDEIREKIIARFDLNNQYYLENSQYVYFFYKNKYWKNSMECIEQDKLFCSEKNGKKIILKLDEVKQ
jgi:hypothetical protein